MTKTVYATCMINAHILFCIQPIDPARPTAKHHVTPANVLFLTLQIYSLGTAYEFL